MVADFNIEMMRVGPDPETVLVTLRDTERPKIGASLQDEAGTPWRVRRYRATEVELQSPPGYTEEFPTGMRLTGEAVEGDDPHPHSRPRRSPFP